MENFLTLHSDFLDIQSIPIIPIKQKRYCFSHKNLLTSQDIESIILSIERERHFDNLREQNDLSYYQKDSVFDIVEKIVSKIFVIGCEK